MAGKPKWVCLCGFSHFGLPPRRSPGAQVLHYSLTPPSPVPLPCPRESNCLPCSPHPLHSKKLWPQQFIWPQTISDPDMPFYSQLSLTQASEGPSGRGPTSPQKSLKLFFIIYLKKVKQNHSISNHY